MSSGREQTRKWPCLIVIVAPNRQLEKIKKLVFGNRRGLQAEVGLDFQVTSTSEPESSGLVFSTFFGRLRLTYWHVESVAAPSFGSQKLIPFLLEKPDQ